MKTIYLSLAMLFLFSVNSFAQRGEHGEKRERKFEEIEAKKIGFLTKKMELDTKQAQDFWPIYNEYTAERKALKEKMKPNFPADRDQLDDKQAETILNNMFEAEAQLLDIKKTYIQKMKAVLPSTKVLAFFKFEEAFMHRILNHAKEKMRGKRFDKEDGRREK